jgi:hypothetical protein
MGDNVTNRFTAHSASFREAQGVLTRSRDCNREQKETKAAVQ